MKEASASRNKGNGFLDPVLLTWVEVLTGLVRDRVIESVTAVEAWGFPSIRKLPPDMDAVVALTLLHESVLELAERDIPLSKLLGKIRKDQGFWSTWAEIRAAAVISRGADDMRMEMEPGSKFDKGPDFQFTTPGGERMSFEFKAVGLSDEESDFCVRAEPMLKELLPPFGFVSLHARLPSPIDLTLLDREFSWNQAQVGASLMPGFPEGLSGVVVVGHGGERNYVQRVVRRLTREAALQIPEGTIGWPVFHWTNGAPVDEVLNALEWSQLPDRVRGLAFVGDAMVFPDANIHTFVQFAPRGATAPEKRPKIRSKSNKNLVEGIYRTIRASSGVRATALVGSLGGETRTLVLRDGRRRIFPFYIQLDEDPQDGRIPFVSEGRRIGADS